MKRLLLFSALALGVSGGALAQDATQRLILANQGDAKSWSYGYVKSIPAAVELIATSDWGKLNIAYGKTNVSTVVVTVAEMTGTWQVTDDNEFYPLEVGKNTITFTSAASSVLLMANSKGNTIKLSSVTIDNAQTTYLEMYNIGFYNMEMSPTHLWASQYLSDVTVAGAASSTLVLTLANEVTTDAFKIAATYTDDKEEQFWDIVKLGGSFNLGANLKEVRIMANNQTTHPISVSSAYLKYATTALAPIASASEVVKTEYYNLAGVRSAAPSKGMNVVVRTMSDGTTQVDKQLVK